MAGKRYPALSALFLGLVLSISLPTSSGQETPVRVWEEPLVIPTYLIGEPERNPIFYSGRAYQGAQGKVYPYPMQEWLTDVRQDKSYQALYLENRYVKLCVLPELGGRIFAATDKTNGYDFFYRQHVIKPALIGMLGAWISGGVEWNMPHHHRASTFMAVDHLLEEHPDGSKTIWVGEIELRHRMKWLIGLTLHPDKSYIEATFKLFNRTPFVHSFLSFANVAVHANQDYQVIFPPGTEFATYHGKTHFTRWPISTSVFNDVDYTRGVDVSWWKNHPSPTSFFAWNYADDFFGGYDHGKQAGVVHVADHHIVPGKKFWEFANGDEGRMWDKILTETDGPYVELMAGAYSDNQPDYSWIQPYEVKTWKQYWYPIRQLGGFKNANLDAAVNLEFLAPPDVKIAINTTSEFRDARVVLRGGEKVLWEAKAALSPAQPFTKEITLPEGVREDELTLAVFSATSRELISYSPRKRPATPLPEAVQPPPAPKDIKTIEELYLTGLRLEQFHNPALEPYPYFEEALKRDPGESRVNTALGILYCKRGMFQEAEEKLRTALRRLTHDYTSPKDGEALYYLGVTLRAQGKEQEAFDAFYKATWSQAWAGAAYSQLTELACRKGDFLHGLEFVERAVRSNAGNARALSLKAAILRRLGRFEEAAELAARAVADDPLDFLAGNELYLAQSKQGDASNAARTLDTLKRRMRGEAQSYLEMAVDYGNGGFYEEATELLTRFVEAAKDAGRVHPMVFYYLGFYADQRGDPTAAHHYYQLAARASPEYCFPFRLESIEVLRHAMKQSPRDARAAYYLGNLLYDIQPANAIRAWEESRALDDTFATLHRNLGLAYARVEDNLPKATASLEKAAALDPSDPRQHHELDMLYQAGGAPPEKRLAKLESNLEAVAKRDDAMGQLVGLYVQVGQYGKAIDILAQRHFHTWEGGGEIHETYVDAHLLRGLGHLEAKRFEPALKDFEAALEYPENLEVGRPFEGGREPQALYFVGIAAEAAGQEGKAQDSLRKAAAKEHKAPEIRYYQGLALRKLGQESDAARLLEGLVNEGRAMLAAGARTDYFAKFGEQQSAAARAARAHYLVGLGYLGQDKKAEARAEFQKALAQDPNHLWARAQLARLK